MENTAVDWLYEQIDNRDMGEIPMWVYEFIEQAKEMDKEHQRQILIGLLDWMNQVAQDNPMAFETDSDDIVDMYLQSVNQKIDKL